MVVTTATWDAAGTLILNYTHTHLLTKKNAQRLYPHHKIGADTLLAFGFKYSLFSTILSRKNLEEISFHLQLQPLVWKASAAQ